MPVEAALESGCAHLCEGAELGASQRPLTKTFYII